MSEGARMSLKRGLVLGAGGVLGAAWLTGALHTLERITGFDPRNADYLMGTSAGSVLAAALGAGVGTQVLVDNQLGIVTNGAPKLDFDPDTVSGGKRPPMPRPGIGSRSVLRERFRKHTYVHPQVALYSLLPEGRGDLEPIGRLVDSVNPGFWSPHPSCWIPAVDLETGRRTVFGSPGAPQARLRDAVMASCAVPGWYHPVRIGGRRYVDGGVRSSTSANLFGTVDVDEVFVLAPMASYEFDQPRSVGALMERGVRRYITRQLTGEVRALRRAGITVHVFTPGPADLEAIGGNLMDPARRLFVLETARRTTAEKLEAHHVGEDAR
ncbi:MAG TPA: patatin-like phospholipase family protein [Streptosporangiales bacterium]